MSKGITSVEGFVRKVFKVSCATDRTMFFRGHSNKREYLLQPSLYRNAGWKADEHSMFSELIASNPTEFASDLSAFEKLVRMQHHSLPTRLLDITSNPLMALYFACDGSPDVDGDGDVIFLKVKNENIKFFDSDTVSCLSNLSRLSPADKSAFDFTLGIPEFNDADPCPRLLHFICQEKPYFQKCMNPADFSRILCVKTKMSNKRIAFQAGSFLLFGHDAQLPEAGSPEIEIERVAISASSKRKIMKELSQLNINVSTVYPLLDNSSKFTAEKYKA